MFQVRVSQRYGNLFVLSVFEKNAFGEQQLFPQCGVPLVFKTDASARNVAKRYIEIMTTLSSREPDFVLRADGISVCHGNRELLDMISNYWIKQGVSLGSITIAQEEVSPEVNDHLAAEPILQAIYKYCL